MNNINYVRLLFCALPSGILAVIIRLAGGGALYVSMTLVFAFLILWTMTKPHANDLGLQTMRDTSQDSETVEGKEEAPPVDPKTGLPYFTVQDKDWSDWGSLSESLDEDRRSP